MTQATEMTNHTESTLVDETPSFTLRTFRAGDLGYIVHRHGLLYHQEFNWGPRFEALVARVVADFVDTYDLEKECCWIAERKENGEFLGCIMLVKDQDAVDPSKSAKLRLLLVEPRSRGLGVGASLIKNCTRFAREAGYARIGLWTQSMLVSARRLYTKEGYKLVSSEEHELFGLPLTGEHWEMTL